MIVRLLKSYTLNTGRVMKVGKIFNRKRTEALQMIENKIAEEYKGPIHHELRAKHKMKTDFFKPKEQWQQQAS